ncbi:MAG: glycine--tRNA ligase subunit beta, partial [Armatimonadetes bacterium]|nr:glycine--tRNA ligase subunit beta [Armatimonadota bacterium]
MPRFVLEIGTEEIPPRFFPPALAQLRRDGRQMLERARLDFEDVKVYGTPRRLVLIAESIADQQAPETREERGPSAKVAFDSDGNPTKAAQGFARRYGLAPEQLVKKETDQGEYVFAVVEAPELPAGEALAGLLPDLIAGLSFPKTMRWGTGKLRF